MADADRRRGVWQRGGAVFLLQLACMLGASLTASAQTIVGTVRDQTGGVLPGVAIAVHRDGIPGKEAITDATGSYRIVEDDSVRSRATAPVNLEAGYRVSKNVRLAVDVFNLLNTSDADIDYFYTSCLPGEPSQGVADVHTHPTLPRTARLNLIVGL
jgi:hypothetical protein